MAKFLSTTGTNYHLEELIKGASDRLILISPFLKLNDRMKELLADKNRLKIDVRIVYGKSELQPQEIEWLRGLTYIRTSFCKNLHAKCYMNEEMCIITSLNLYEFSQVNNNEMGILIQRSDDGQLYKDAYEEAQRIIRISDDAIGDWDDALLVGSGQVGEITVAGPSATDSYFNRDAQTALAKIRERLADGSERIVHRMGDLGWFDGEGRLWFCGRKSQRVVVDDLTTLCTEQVEPVFNTHPLLLRSALVGVGEKGAQRPVLVYELMPGVNADVAEVSDELRHIAEGFVHTGKVKAFLHHPKPFPVDIRHNAKIGREKLAAWAAKQAIKETE